MSKIILQITDNNYITTLATLTREQREYILNYLGILKEHEKVLLEIEKKLITPEIFIDEVCKYFQVKKEILYKPIQTRQIAYARSVIFYFYVNHLNYTTVRTGRLFNRSYSTVSVSLNKTAPKLMKQYQEIMSKILLENSAK